MELLTVIIIIPGRTGVRQCATNPSIIGARSSCVSCVYMYSISELHPLCTVYITIAPRVLHFAPFERVELFEHLGLVIQSSDLSRSNHITSISVKAKRILGLLYRQYVLQPCWGACPQTTLYLTCQNTPGKAGIQLWTLKNKRNFEQVQKFACKMASKHALLRMLDTRICWS